MLEETETSKEYEALSIEALVYHSELSEQFLASRAAA
jgi:hypothetical protein